MLPAFPLSPRLLAFPLWGLVAGWRGLWQWGAPLLEVQVGSRSPLPLPHQLRAVAEAPGVRGLWLKVDRLVLDGGQATLLDTVEAIRAVRAAGRLVVAEFEFVGNAELVLAAACDRAWLRPTTQVFCLGLGTTLRFYGDLLARFGASFDVEAVGEFKSFGETFSRGFASSANREAMSELLAGLSDEWIATLAELRPALGEAGVRDAIANAPLTASDAVKRGFFTATAYPDEVAAEVQTLVGTEPRTVSFAGWYKAWLRADRLERWMQGFGLVAVVWLRGAVMDGEGMAGAQAIAATPVVKALDALREDKSVRAVVLSVSSPGGSAPASDLIWRAVGRLASAKPVVARYGDISASGGVYLAASAIPPPSPGASGSSPGSPYCVRRWRSRAFTARTCSSDRRPTCSEKPPSARVAGATSAPASRRPTAASWSVWLRGESAPYPKSSRWPAGASGRVAGPTRSASWTTSAASASRSPGPAFSRVSARPVRGTSCRLRVGASSSGWPVASWWRRSRSSPPCACPTPRASSPRHAERRWPSFRSRSRSAERQLSP
jgi:hypothetical protein